MANITNENIYMVRLAEQTERYDDMLKYIKIHIKDKGSLNQQERNLFAIAYKNLVSSRRTAWRAITALEVEESLKKTRNVEIIKYYKEKIEEEIKEYCRDILHTIDITFSKEKFPKKDKIYFLKMQGDYYRYLSEITLGDEHKKNSQQALKFYQKALEKAEQFEGLNPTEPLRLGLCLNFSVFHYEIMSDPKEACSVAKKAFDQAIENLDKLDEGEYKDSTTIMQLLRDNMTMWMSEQNEDDDKKKK